MDGSWSLIWSDFLKHYNEKGQQKPVSGIFHEEKVIGAGFNLLVNRAEDDEEEDAVDPLDWLNCAADKLANVAEDEAVMMHLKHSCDNITV